MRADRGDAEDSSSALYTASGDIGETREIKEMPRFLEPELPRYAQALRAVRARRVIAVALSTAATVTRPK